MAAVAPVRFTLLSLLVYAVVPVTLMSVVEPLGTLIATRRALPSVAELTSNTLSARSVPVSFNSSAVGPSTLPFAGRSAHCAERSRSVANCAAEV